MPASEARERLAEIAAREGSAWDHFLREQKECREAVLAIREQCDHDASHVYVDQLGHVETCSACGKTLSVSGE